MAQASGCPCACAALRRAASGRAAPSSLSPRQRGGHRRRHRAAEAGSLPGGGGAGEEEEQDEIEAVTQQLPRRGFPVRPPCGSGQRAEVSAAGSAPAGTAGAGRSARRQPPPARRGGAAARGGGGGWGCRREGRRKEHGAATGTWPERPVTSRAGAGGGKWLLRGTGGRGAGASSPLKPGTPGEKGAVPDPAAVATALCTLAGKGRLQRVPGHRSRPVP